MTITHENATEAAGRLSLSLNGLATDLDTEHGGTDANKRDGARQVGRLAHNPEVDGLGGVQQSVYESGR